MKSGPPLALAVIVLVLWETTVRVFKVPPYLIPGPLAVIKAGRENAVSLALSVVQTFEASMLAWLLSAFVGVAVAMLMSQSKILEVSLYPYAIILQTIPVVSIAPLIVIWFGAGRNAVVVIAFIISLFPVISNATAGLTSTDHNLKNLFVMYNAGRWQTLIKLKIPYALPFLLAGLRISSGLSIIGAIVGEFIAGIGGGRGGLGYTITVAANRMEMGYLFAAAFSSSLLGILIFFAMSWITTRTLHWHESTGKFEN